MKITHDAVRKEVEAWAAKEGQRAVAIKVTESALHLRICDGLQPITDSNGTVNEKAVYNNRQQLFRWIRSNGKVAVKRINELLPAIEMSLPGYQRARLSGDDLMYKASIASRKCADAVGAVIVKDPDSHKELSAAINALRALRPSVPVASPRMNF